MRLWLTGCAALSVMAAGVVVFALAHSPFRGRDHHPRPARPHALCRLAADGPTRLYYCLDGHGWVLTVRTGRWQDLGELPKSFPAVPA